MTEAPPHRSTKAGLSWFRLTLSLPPPRSLEVISSVARNHLLLFLTFQSILLLLFQSIAIYHFPINIIIIYHFQNVWPVFFVCCKKF